MLQREISDPAGSVRDESGQDNDSNKNWDGCLRMQVHKQQKQQFYVESNASDLDKPDPATVGLHEGKYNTGKYCKSDISRFRGTDHCVAKSSGNADKMDCPDHHFAEAPDAMFR